MNHVLAARRFAGSSHPLRLRAGLAPALSPAAVVVDLRAKAGPVRSQQQTNACAGETIAALSFLAAGGRGAYPSARAAYSLGRMQERERIGAPLVDLGANLIDCAHGIVAQDGKLRGLVAEARCPSGDVVTVDDELGLDVLEDLAPALPGDVHALASVGDQLGADIVATLLEGIGVGFGMPVDQAYEDWSGGVYPGITGRSLGGHAQTIVGARPGAFLVRNSWGEDWAERGHVWIAADFITRACWDFVVVERAPVLA